MGLSNVTFSAPSWLIFPFSFGCLNYGLWSNKVKFVYIHCGRRLTLQLFIEVYKSSERAAGIIARWADRRGSQQGRGAAGLRLFTLNVFSSTMELVKRARLVFCHM